MRVIIILHRQELGAVPGILFTVISSVLVLLPLSISVLQYCGSDVKFS